MSVQIRKVINITSALLVLLYMNSFSHQSLSPVIRTIIDTTSAPAAIGPYSQAVIVGRTMYIAGQVGNDATSGQLVDGGVQAQTEQALINMGEILSAAGADYTNVVKTTVLLADINDFSSVNEVYRTFFTSNFPARAAYQVAALPIGALVEIEAIAVLSPLSDSDSHIPNHFHGPH